MMDINKFGIEIDLLTGRYIATSYNNRRQTEWPPHPARLFSALVAKFAEAGSSSEERRALEWFEALKPPAIHASRAGYRRVVSHFVPINDTSIVSHRAYMRKAEKMENLSTQLMNDIASGNRNENKMDKLKQKRNQLAEVKSLVTDVGNSNASSAEAMLPDQRKKQERFYPSCTPEVPRVTYIWHTCFPEEIGQKFEELLTRVTRLGHSSSLVSCRITTNPPDANFEPSDEGELTLRTVRSGQLAELERCFLQHQACKPRVLPFTTIKYVESSNGHAESSLCEPTTAGDWILFEFASNSRALPQTRTLEIAKAMRSSIFRYIEYPIPEEISGHKSDGTPTKLPHIAFIPIPFVGWKHADGRLLGIAISLPNTISNDAQSTLFRAIGKWEGSKTNGILHLYFGSKGSIDMYRLRSRATLKSLQQSTWRRNSRRWASVTPIALPRHPGRLFGGTHAARKRAWRLAEQAVVESCKHVDLPNPTTVIVSSSPFIVGCHPAMHFPPLMQNARTGKTISRQIIHATVEFPDSIKGPLLLGAGRFFGLGLMRPVDELDDWANSNARENADE